ncbi:MAG: YraN family protein [Pseudomonadales bacterium]
MTNEKNTLDLGYAAEEMASQFLQQHGLELISKNFRCRMGEIDLIMREGNTLVFVEVRLRQTRNYVSGAESITRRKIARLLKTAEFYLISHPVPDHIEFRFDVVSMDSSIDWIKSAFTADQH